MALEVISTDQVDRVAIVTLNRPEVLNALNLKLVREVDEFLTEAEADDGIGAVIITGAGERAFSAGADIHENREFTQEQRDAGAAERSNYTWHMAACTKPVIGAINGLCYGGGTVMATSMDFLIGCEKSSFRFLAVNYGQLNATWSLPTLVGWGKAKELLYSGREVFAEEAYHIGLLNHLVPSEQLMEKTIEVAAGIAKKPARRREQHQAAAHRAHRQLAGGAILDGDRGTAGSLPGPDGGGGLRRLPGAKGTQARGNLTRNSHTDTAGPPGVHSGGLCFSVEQSTCGWAGKNWVFRDIGTAEFDRSLCQDDGEAIVPQTVGGVCCWDFTPTLTLPLRGRGFWVRRGVADGVQGRWWA